MGLRAPQRTVLAGLGAPHPDMMDRYMWGAAPHPNHGNKEYMRGSASRSDRAGIIYAGFHPAP